MIKAKVTVTKDAHHADNVTGSREEDEILKDIDASRAVIAREPRGIIWRWRVTVWSGTGFYAESYWIVLTKAGAERRGMRVLNRERKVLNRRLENVRGPLVIR